MRHYSRHKKKNSTKIFVAVTILVALVFGAYTYFNIDKNEILVAKVNNQKIFKSDIERKLRDVFDGQAQEIKAPEIDKLPREVLEILVKEIYLEKELTKEAKKSKLVRSKENMARAEEAKSRTLRQIYIDSLLKEEISEQKINDKYAELVNNLSGKKEYHISHIVVQDEAEADKILKELKAKKAPKFADLAKKYSIDKASSQKGGDLGYILEDNMIQEISEAVNDLKDNEVSAPIKTKFGWHLIKISDSREATILPFESVKDNIRDQLVQNKINEINNRITKDSRIEILLKLQEKPAEAPEKEEATDAENNQELSSDEVQSQESVAQEESPEIAEDIVINDEVIAEPKAEVKEVKKESKSTKKTDKKESKAGKDKKKSAAKKNHDKEKKSR